MSKRKSVRSVACLVVCGLAVGTLAAYGAHSRLNRRANSHDTNLLQVANRDAKTDRLALYVQASLTSAVEATDALATAGDPIDHDRLDGAFAMATPTEAVAPKPVAVAPKEVVAPVPPAPVKHAALTPPTREAAPVVAPKPKHQPPPQASNGILDDSQIAGLKGRLRLTSDQAEYWPAVEEALRDVVRTQLRGHHPRGKLAIDVNSPEVQKLIWAAMPLLMRLREDQKGEVRKLARVMGLEQVASQI